MKPKPTICNNCEFDPSEEDHWVWEKDKRYRHGGKWRCRYRKLKDQAAYRARRKLVQSTYHPLSELQRRESLYRAYKKSDKEKGHETSPFSDLRFLFGLSCIYCGSDFRIGLDRVDNEVGHTRDNCRPACANCNLVLIDMPFAMKMILGEGLRLSRKMGFTWIHPRLRKLSHYR